jgi:hypothetical protein
MNTITHGSNAECLNVQNGTWIRCLGHESSPKANREAMLIAMEWGFRAHEKGMNLQMAYEKFRELL